MQYSAIKILKNKKSVAELFANFKDDRLPFLLESRANIRGMGRYSFFGSDPFLTIRASEGCSLLDEGGRKVILRAPLLLTLRELFKKYALETNKKSAIPFLCGAVGFFGYDFGFSLEAFERENSCDPLVPDAMFAFYDRVVCVDHFKGELIVFSSGFPEQGSLRKKRADARLKEVCNKLAVACADPKESTHGRILRPSALTSNFSKKRYLAAIAKAKEHIAAGDIYQVNLSQQFSTRLAIDDWVLYQRLLKNFPVSFSGFFKDEDFSIISASPEKFLNFDGRVVSTRPMKGTRRRTLDASLNLRFREDLVRSKKEKAELLMIVDLERNDLGRVCDYGSVKVKTLREIEAYSNVFQATAEITGVLHESKDRMDLIRACFPGGSVTGCPKIRAMEIIEELEPDTRSIYTGSLGYLSFHNTLQFNILIRSFLKKGDQIFFNVGGGIVADSNPEDEYEETLIKSEALKRALTEA